MSIKQTTLDFLSNLTKHNNKEWFINHRAEYDKTKSNFLDIVTEMLYRISEFDSSIFPETKYVKIFRINKDVRFSKDKSPYKTNLGAFISKEPKRMDTIGYYIHIEPNGKSGIAGGFVSPDSKQMNKMRDYIAEHYEELDDLINDEHFDAYFKRFGDQDMELKTVPRGFDKNHPAKDYLRQKRFTVWHPIDDTKVLSEDFVEYVEEGFRQVKRLLDWLKKGI